MKDFTDKELKVGQVVICITGNYKKFKVGTVTKITDKMVLIETKYGHYRIFPNQTIIADNEMTLKYKLNAGDKYGLYRNY